MRCLFIGGPNDGERHEIADTRRMVVVLPEYQPCSMVPYTTKNPTVLTHRPSEYIKVELRGETTQHFVYVHKDGFEHTADTALTKLIEKYPRPARS